MRFPEYGLPQLPDGTEYCPCCGTKVDFQPAQNSTGLSRKNSAIGLLIVVGIVLFVIVIAGLSACSTPLKNISPSGSVSPTSQDTKKPQLIKSWAGTGIKTTEEFTVNSKFWYIIWLNDPTMFQGLSLGTLQIMVYDANQPNSLLATAVNTNARGTNTSYLNQLGTFYLDINAENTSWSVRVYQ
jgi:hypothetical protein